MFELTAPLGGRGPWTENVLYVFGSQSSDGANPVGQLIFDASGVLYGVTLEGGEFGPGTAYKLSPPLQGEAWTESVLYSFRGPGEGGDGAYPVGSLALDSASGSLYGVTDSGGNISCGMASYGCGTVFEISPPALEGNPWTEDLLYSFLGGSDGDSPQAGVILVGTALYGTTWLGGTGYCNSPAGNWGCGTIFQVDEQ